MTTTISSGRDLTGRYGAPIIEQQVRSGKAVRREFFDRHGYARVAEPSAADPLFVTTLD